MKIISNFENNEPIPKKYTADGENINPELKIKEIPKTTKSLVLIVDDPDATRVCGHTWIHWIVYNIPPSKEIIEENSIPGLEIKNSFGNKKYGGPSPPPESKTHNYYFKIFALNKKLKENMKSLSILQENMKNSIIDSTQIIGKYSR